MIDLPAHASAWAATGAVGRHPRNSGRTWRPAGRVAQFGPLLGAECSSRHYDRFKSYELCRLLGHRRRSRVAYAATSTRHSYLDGGRPFRPTARLRARRPAVWFRACAKSWTVLARDSSQRHPATSGWRCSGLGSTIARNRGPVRPHDHSRTRATPAVVGRAVGNGLRVGYQRRTRLNRASDRYGEDLRHSPQRPDIARLPSMSEEPVRKRARARHRHWRQRHQGRARRPRNRRVRRRSDFASPPRRSRHRRTWRRSSVRSWRTSPRSSATARSASPSRRWSPTARPAPPRTSTSPGSMRRPRRSSKMQLGRDIMLVNDADAAGVAEVHYGAANGPPGPGAHDHARHRHRHARSSTAAC